MNVQRMMAEDGDHLQPTYQRKPIGKAHKWLLQLSFNQMRQLID